LKGSTTLDVGDITFDSTTTGWTSTQLQQFAPLVQAATGLVLLKYGGRFGLPLAAALGVLFDLGSLSSGTKFLFPLPTCLALPGSWPTLQFQHPTTPWIDLQQQLSALLAKGDNMQTMLRLLGWSITAAVPPVPLPLPDNEAYGTQQNPWSVLLSN